MELENKKSCPIAYALRLYNSLAILKLEIVPAKAVKVSTAFGEYNAQPENLVGSIGHLPPCAAIAYYGLVATKLGAPADKISQQQKVSSENYSESIHAFSTNS